MYGIEEIKNYILYLKTQCGLSVSLHPLESEPLIIPSELMAFNFHENSYCIYIKTHPEAHRHCVQHQKKVLAACGEGGLCGTCHAGVREYVYPIRQNGKAIGFISVGGYQCEKPKQYIDRTAQRFGIPPEQLQGAYPSLKRELPEKKQTDTLLYPLCAMLELAYRQNGQETPTEEWIDGVVLYLRQHRAQDVTVEELCRHFACSRSHISHLFKSKVGKGIREFLTELRIEDARELLAHSELNVTEIAYSVGFGDSNYFSSVFKRSVGRSPLQYRKDIKGARS